ncbi:YesL family protein [Acetivibrio cellulolyticus]|uniref:YesL family protein n=1 Tax=Acetivibrio cellulolyticus TaxID=35830 RepID=UPI0001E2D515|nr:DUF624 domain-containing protein [Acetivibrio cellulolyticus]
MPILPNYSKSGPEAAKEDNRSRLKAFFDIYTTKFTKLVLLNLMNIIFNLPAIFIAFLLINYFLSSDKMSGGLNLFIAYTVTSLLVCIPLITVGPFQAGFTYVLRNFAREENTFIFDDFKEHSKRNWKQGLAVSLIDMAVTAVLIMEINYFYNQTSLLGNITFWLIIISFFVFSMMHMYIYQMMVTIELTVFQIYKNAFLLTLINFLKNTLVYLLCLAVIIILSIFMPIGILGFIFISTSTIGFIINYHAHASIKKYLIDPVQAKENKEENLDKE